MPFIIFPNNKGLIKLKILENINVINIINNLNLLSFNSFNVWKNNDISFFKFLIIFVTPFYFINYVTYIDSCFLYEWTENINKNNVANNEDAIII